MVNTTMAAGAGALSTLLVSSLAEGRNEDGKFVVRLESANNGVLAGLVSITAGCATAEPYGALIVGLLAGAVYVFSSRLLKRMGVDDVVDSCPIHGFCGCFGVIAASFFSTRRNYAAAYYSDRADKCAGVFYGGDGSSLAAAIVSIISIVAWALFWSSLVFASLRHLGVLRVEESVEEDGMDSSEHGYTSKPRPQKGVSEETAGGDSKTPATELTVTTTPDEDQV